MSLRKYEGKNVKITTDDGQIFIGCACDFCEAEDNEPERESICIGIYELYENEIESIELLD